MAKRLVLLLGLLAGCGPTVTVSEAGAPPCELPPEPPAGAAAVTIADADAGARTEMFWAGPLTATPFTYAADGRHSLQAVSPIGATLTAIDLTTRLSFERYPEGSVLATGGEILAVTLVTTPHGAGTSEAGFPAALTVSAWPRAELTGVVCLPDRAIRFNRVRLDMPRR
jgi:hypothetical protein